MNEPDRVHSLHQVTTVPALPFALEARHVDKIYPAFPSKKVLDDVTLQVPSNQCFALVGANGAGKSTLIKSWLHLTSPSRGTLSIFGQDASLKSARERVAYLPEQFAPQDWLQVRDYLRVVLNLHQLRWDEGIALEGLLVLGLEPDVLRRRMEQCSKGMRQKVGLIAAWLSQRELLILDEPMSGLDPIARVQTKRLIQSMKAQGRTIFMSTHALEDVGALADQVAVMHGGKVCFNGTVFEWLTRYRTDNLEQAYLSTVQGSY